MLPETLGGYHYGISMRLWPVVGLIVALAVGISASQWWLVVGAYGAYVIWMYVRIPLERRQRMRGFNGGNWGGDQE